MLGWLMAGKGWMCTGYCPWGVVSDQRLYLQNGPAVAPLYSSRVLAQSLWFQNCCSSSPAGLHISAWTLT